MAAKNSSRLCRSVGEASDLLKSIANPNRLSIVCMLMEGERSVAELERELGIHQPTLSQQLSALKDAKIVAARREAKHIIYRVADHRVARVIVTLRDIFGDLEEWCARFEGGAGVDPAKSNGIDMMAFD
jgi:DNA-binding transcriptional ArsR family regulator